MELINFDNSNLEFKNNNEVSILKIASTEEDDVKSASLFFNTYTNNTEQFYDVEISVIIPFYNSKKYIGHCLESLRKQTFKSFEAICINDGSNDGSGALVDDYCKQDNRFHQFLQTNKGAGLARNKGIELAKGNYIMFLDSDDFLPVYSLQKFLKKAKETQADVVLAQAEWFNDKTKEKGLAKYCLNEDYLPKGKKIFCARDVSDFVLRITGGAPWGKLFNRSFIINNNIRFLSLKRSEDFYFVQMCLLLANKISYIKQRLWVYRINNDCSLESTKDQAPLVFWDANITFINDIKGINKYSEFERSILNDVVVRCVYNFNKVEELSSAKKIFNLIKYVVNKEFKLTDYKEGYFYEKKAYSGIIQIINANTFEEYLWQTRKKRMFNSNGYYMNKREIIYKAIKNLCKSTKRKHIKEKKIV